MAVQYFNYAGKLLRGRYGCIAYDKDTASNVPLTGDRGLNNAYYIRDYLLSRGWKPNQIVGAVASAQQWGLMNPARGFGVPDATTGGFWNKNIITLRNVWRSAYGFTKYNYIDPPLMLMNGHVAENSGFNYTGILGDASMTFRSYLTDNMLTVGECFFYFYHGYVHSGTTSQLLSVSYCESQGRYWYRVLFNTDPSNPDGEGDPDVPPSTDPSIIETIKRLFFFRFFVFTLSGCGIMSSSRKRTYLRGDTT